ncbi:MAG: hypothetical protein RRC07_07610 [Anaerolineae bacterium]|nr:hypothetical protein [Anaerolineae bacterium]
MEQIIIRIRDKEKARLLLQLLRSLDFVENIEVEETVSNSGSETTTEENGFFSLAGLWEGRDISLESLRRAAWPRQTR